MRMLLLVTGALTLTAAVAIPTLPATTSPPVTCECFNVEADVAFVGRPVPHGLAGGALMVDPAGASDGRAVEFTPSRWPVVLEVDRVYKGDVGPRIEILAETGTSCRLIFGPGTTGLLAYRNDNGLLSANMCSVSSADALKHRFGAGHPPDPSIGLHGPDQDSALVDVDSGDQHRSAAPAMRPGQQTERETSDGGSLQVDARASTATGGSEDPSPSSVPVLAVVLVLVVAITVPTSWLLVSRRRARRTAPRPRTGTSGRRGGR